MQIDSSDDGQLIPAGLGVEKCRLWSAMAAISPWGLDDVQNNPTTENSFLHTAFVENLFPWSYLQAFER